MIILFLSVVAGLITSVMGASTNGGQRISYNDSDTVEIRRYVDAVDKVMSNYSYDNANEILQKIYQMNCSCRNQCNGNTGTKSKACYENRRHHILCEGTTCSVKTCPENHIYYRRISACVPCPTGQHVASSNEHCACDRGTRFSLKTPLVCVPCPANAIITPDECFCNSTEVISENVCRPCPSGSVKIGRWCYCVDPNMFWHAETSSCLACPSTARRPPTLPILEYCLCLETNQVFNRVSLTCITCPENSIFVNHSFFGATCRCSRADHRYDHYTNTCVHRWSVTFN